ncbi:hypothetical protein DL766_003667 [Monosporascus sp. MC13-8B]|uniref:F-box domain-containing protein n=1 Tax=Monosporascus cannonballus TaxID=155416 RepID=A0ABY0H3B6_9PEZI|nr:hypothetical protein DL762_005982 [Monosporascus cannonballus]RYO93640.1 hypothetical protein DL763_004315 [Monosporascus cannonballus]RYP33074.1 hypothetical protein DL766_003667 [Monosporascus sp. MC13-8B]
MTGSAGIPTDPLVSLPPEIVLRILDFSPVSTVAALTCCSRAWHAFIDQTHQNLIYSNNFKTEHSPSTTEPSLYHSEVQSFSKYYENTSSWKELCKKQTLLRRNLASKAPTTTESIFTIRREPVWRFRPDFKRRFIVSTSQFGGIEVTCMDTGRRLWALSRDVVRPYAHLEYDDVDGRGTAVWDRNGDSLEIWRTTKEDGGERGVFEQIAVLHHDCETRGYQLSFNTLCVVSSQGQGFVYDMLQEPPQLVTHVKMENNAVGHLYQDHDCVLYSLGTKGFHVHSKATGEYLGAIEPWKCSPHRFYYIDHPELDYTDNDQDSLALASAVQSMRESEPIVFPPRWPSTGRSVPLSIQPGVSSFLGQDSDDMRDQQLEALQDDDWGAGKICGDLMVGVSRGGRVVIVRNWRDCLSGLLGGDTTKAAEALARNALIVQCAPHDDPRNFDLGGWLSVRNGRIVVEVRDQVYILSLKADGSPATGEQAHGRPSYAISKSATAGLGSAVPVSFVALYDDCVMYTYGVVGMRREEDAEDHHGNPYSRLFLTKAVRVLSFAPS